MKTIIGALPGPARGRRVTAIFAAVAAVLVLAPVGSAAFAPRVTATTTSTGAVSISYTQPAWHEGPALLTFYAPSAYVPKLNTTAGATVGTATVRAVPAGEDTPLVLQGSLRVAGATTPLTGGAAATVGDAAKACTGADTSTVLWLATLQIATPKGAFQLPVAVQKVESGMLAGRVALSICPPPADVPVGTAGRAPLGLEIARLTLRLPGVFEVPTGMHTWNLRATPYAPGLTVANSASSVEAEARHGVPQRLTFFARREAGAKRARLAGRLTLADEALAEQTIRVLANGRQIATVKTDEEGRYAGTVPVGSGATKLRVVAKVPAKYSSRCLEPAFASLPCTASILAGFTLRSPTIVVRT